MQDPVGVYVHFCTVLCLVFVDIASHCDINSPFFGGHLNYSCLPLKPIVDKNGILLGIKMTLVF
jgi:hypothetical protein